jgi:uncharacterized protein
MSSTLLAFLQSPATYGQGEAVHTIETHGATVFLVGDAAYKLKKNVSFPYMDYGTRERRLACCQEEILRNRRTAPALYQGLVYIGEHADGALFLSDVLPERHVDTLVHMRRFDTNQVLDIMAAREGLSPALVQTLAAQVVAFHQQAEPVPGLAGAERLRQTILGNDGQFEAFHAVLSRRDTGALTQASLQAIERFQALLDKRAASGRVRRCHGDLHLRNICLWQGEPLLFDCIEFNDAFADIDVLYDLAFLLMDLRQRGLDKEAGAVLAFYASHTDEEEGLSLLPLLLSVRAAIRAHVSVAISQALSGDAKAAMEAEAQGYLQAALSYLTPPVLPMLTAIGGLSGSGKTTEAIAMAAKAPYPLVLRSDVLRKQHAGVADTDRLPPAAYSEESTALVYGALFRKAEYLLRAGFSVVLDAVFALPTQRQEAEAVARRAGVAFEGKWKEVSTDTANARLSARTGDASDATPAIRALQEQYDVGVVTWERKIS